MKTLVIAEAGVNHNGNLSLAFDLIDAASAAGADIIKFQTFRAKQLASDFAQQATYQQKTVASQYKNQLEMLKKLELDYDDYLQLVDYCKVRKIGFLSSAFDHESLDFLASLKPSLWKIPSGEITNLPYLRKVSSFCQPVLLSTGMSNLSDIESAIRVFEDAGMSRRDITLLHCTTEYPAPLIEVNLNAMLSIRHAFSVSVGYSDHTEGYEIPIAAVALGASVIEKHITLSCDLPGPDHMASLEPSQFTEMVSCIRSVEVAMGDGIKRPTKSEIDNIKAARKSLVASKFIRAGEILTSENITCKRPGNGISPMNWDVWLGKPASRDFLPDELID